MTDPDRLAKIKRERTGGAISTDDLDWLVGKVERLRGLLARLEWAGTTCYDAYGAEHTCLACRVQWDTAADFKGHAAGCWLAAELHRERPG